MNNYVIRQQGDDPGMRQHNRLIQKLRAVFLFRPGHAPVSVDHSRERPFARRHYQRRGNNTAGWSNCLASIADWSGVGNVIDFYARAVLGAELLNIQWRALV